MPRATAERILLQLEKGEAPAAVVLLGVDPYWRQLCRQKLTEALVPAGAREWAVERVSAEEHGAADVVIRAQMRPMLARCQLLFVGNAEAWEQGGEEKLKHTLAALGGYLEDPAPFTVLVLEAERLDQRTRLARLLAERALVVELDATEAEPDRLAAQMARGLGVEIEPGAAAALVEATGGRAARMAVELEKLACHAGDRGRISTADVGELVVAEGSSEVWELAELFALGKRDRALELVNELLQKGESAPKLVGAMAWMFRKLVMAFELAPNTNGWQAARQLAMRPESAEIALRHARRIPQPQLREALVVLAEADDRLKSGGGDEGGVMEFLITRLSRLGASDSREQVR